MTGGLYRRHGELPEENVRKNGHSGYRPVRRAQLRGWLSRASVPEGCCGSSVPGSWPALRSLRFTFIHW
jgi:hypothetical protein